MDAGPTNGDPAGPAPDPAGPALDPAGPAPDPAGPALDPAGPALDLTDDPLEALAENDRHRGAPGADGNAGLWTVDQWAAADIPPYRFGAPTFAPPHWQSSQAVGQLAYSARFAAEFPEVAAILPIAHVYVAGGAAAWPLGPATARAGDVDLFIAGVDPADRAALWGKAAEVVERLRRVFICGVDGRGTPHAACIITEVLTPGLITLTARYRNFGEKPRDCKVQVILRAFPHISAILHGFDVPACCVAYDGRAARLTYLAAWAHAFRVNVVCPEYRSTTYERRLIKYFGRGYALALPHLRRGALVKGGPLWLPHLVLRPQAVQGLYATGTAELPPGEAPPLSDYDPAELAEGVETEWSQAPINLRELVSGKGRYAIIGKINCELVRRGAEAFSGVGLPLARYAAAEPTFSDALPPEEFERLVATAADSIVRGGLVNVAALHRVFRFTAEEVSRFTATVLGLFARHPGRKLDITPALARHRAALGAAYGAAPAKVEWWIVNDPSRQYTVSLNPRMETPDLWYGPSFDGGAGPPSADALLTSALALLERRRCPVDESLIFSDGECPLCQEPLTRGEINSTILACGHSFHWSETRAGCLGLVNWISKCHKYNCPTCRHEFTPPTKPPRAPPPPAIPIGAEW
jgi:hypothetical protein